MKTLLVAAGGTGGHIYPGLAVAKVMAEREWTVRFAGTIGGMEAGIVPAAGFPLDVIAAAPLSRGHPIQNVGALGTNLRGVREAIRMVRELMPAVVLGMGGYVSVPASAAALRLGIPLALHEQNAIPGLANRFFGRFAGLRMAATAGHDERLERAGWNVVGMPVEASFGTIGRAAARLDLRIAQDRFVLLVFGGSRGSMAINNAVLEALPRWSNMTLVWVTGSGEHARVSERLEALRVDPGLEIRLLDYATNMPVLMAAADLAVTRAGAMTLAELAATPLPAVLVPYPFAAENHQEANARERERHGGAVVIRNAELNDRLYDMVSELKTSLGRLEEMKSSAGACTVSRAAERIADLIEELSRTGAK